MAAPLQDLLERVVGPEASMAVEAYDGSRVGPPDAPATVVLRSPTALRRIVTAPGELGLARAYVGGDLEVEGDVYAALGLRDLLPRVRFRARDVVTMLRTVGASGLRRLPPPPEESRLRGRKHGRARDAAAIAHHYDVSNAFYRIVLGPSMTYSCALWTAPEIGLEDAQAAKHELICRKLDLRPGMRLLDVGCGWGAMLLHAARFHGVEALGVTISHRQVELARRSIDEAGLAGRVTVKLLDYRDLDDGPFDATSSIGMFEHVGQARLAEYFARMYALLRPGGRFLNHGISRPPGDRARFARRGFVNRYVFPDGELHEIGSVVSSMQRAGFEVRHVESLREHYALTLRAWVANLERSWGSAVAEAGAGRARVWRLYMAGSALGFEENRIQVHQTLAVRSERGRSGVELRPRWEDAPLTRPSEPDGRDRRRRAAGAVASSA